MLETYTDLAQRFDANPLIRPADVRPSHEGLMVECLLNPGAFRYNGRIGLLLRVAERPRQETGWLTVPVHDEDDPTGVRILRFSAEDPALKIKDPRVFWHHTTMYLTTLSHLRLAWSDDGIHFEVESRPALRGFGPHEAFGVEDCRVTEIEGTYYLTYTAVSIHGVAVAMASTRDWLTFERHGIIMPPHNKDCTLFNRRIDGAYYALHRPSGVDIGGNYMWIARSPDLIHWGQHTCLARTRPGLFDAQRLGAGAEPIETAEGWLEIYHGATAEHRYCLGGLLLDLENPSRVVARSTKPFMEPLAPYEQTGFFGNVVFTNGHVVDGDTVTVYYGASDEVVCGARLSIREMLASMRET